MKPIALNRKAYHEYEILEKFEAGIVLTGSEIKSIRQGRVNLAGGFCRIQGNETWILNLHLAKAEEPERSRKLLLHRAQIQSLLGKTQQKGLSLIPLSLYLKKGKAKLQIALARGKKLYDRREEIKKRDIKRQTERELKE
ncbi:MAG TPA: SsrA-binding protein SmpB [Patescibacteria group bacterium]|nr:SsrA-binding protein SmpB [Patescibacteria group bacterium]